MIAPTTPLAEITNTAIHLLCQQIGPVNTARFLNQFTTGWGDYTEERESLLGETTVDQIVEEIMKKRNPIRKATE